MVHTLGFLPRFAIQNIRSHFFQMSQRLLIVSGELHEIVLVQVMFGVLICFWCNFVLQFVSVKYGFF